MAFKRLTTLASIASTEFDTGYTVPVDKVFIVSRTASNIVGNGAFNYQFGISGDIFDGISGVGTGGHGHGLGAIFLAGDNIRIKSDVVATITIYGQETDA